MKHNVPLRPWLAAAAVLLVFAALAGCSRKPPVVTQAAPVESAPVESVKPAPRAESEQTSAPDYANLDPSQYGIEDVFFGYDQYGLDDAAMGVLNRDARILKEAKVAVVVAGHCDERGTIEYNLALGEKRARATRDYLVSLGVAGDRVKVTSYGETRPFSGGHAEADWAQNRRAHFERP